MIDPHNIVLMPVLTEKSVILGSEGKYAFWVNPNANRTEIAQAIEAIFNEGKKKEKDRIQVVKVNVISVRGKTKRTNWRIQGRRPDRKKAIITLAEGQTLEGFGV